MKTFKARYRSERSSVGIARRAVSDFARLCGFDRAALGDIENAVGEALANAVEHGHRDRAWFRVICEFEAGTLTTEVKDLGEGFDFQQPVAMELTDLRARGFGRTIMCACMDDVHYADGGTRVRLIKRVSAEGAQHPRVQFGGVLRGIFQNSSSKLDARTGSVS
jgi:anti-sigma regulatory factor (Ser/Thr protein kinase)